MRVENERYFAGMEEEEDAIMEDAKSSNAMRKDLYIPFDEPQEMGESTTCLERKRVVAVGYRHLAHPSTRREIDSRPGILSEEKGTPRNGRLATPATASSCAPLEIGGA